MRVEVEDEFRLFDPQLAARNALESDGLTQVPDVKRVV